MYYIVSHKVMFWDCSFLYDVHKASHRPMVLYVDDYIVTYTYMIIKKIQFQLIATIALKNNFKITALETRLTNFRLNNS